MNQMMTSFNQNLGTTVSRFYNSRENETPQDFLKKIRNRQIETSASHGRNIIDASMNIRQR